MAAYFRLTLGIEGQALGYVVQMMAAINRFYLEHSGDTEEPETEEEADGTTD